MDITAVQFGTAVVIIAALFIGWRIYQSKKGGGSGTGTGGSPKKPGPGPSKK